MRTCVSATRTPPNRPRRVLSVLAGALCASAVLGCFDVSLAGYRCSESHLCSDGYQCVGGRCVDESTLETCTSDVSCGAAAICSNGYCVPDPHHVPTDAAGDTAAYDKPGDASGSDAGAEDRPGDGGALDLSAGDALEDVPRLDASGDSNGTWDSGAPDISPADAPPSDSHTPDTRSPDRYTPDVRLPDTSHPDTSLPDTSLPDARISCSNDGDCGGQHCVCADAQCAVKFCAPQACGQCEYTLGGSDCDGDLDPGEPCDDGFDCTDSDLCSGGSCGGSPVDCAGSELDGDCHAPGCVEGTGCVPAQQIDDSDVPAAGNPCVVGSCSGGVPATSPLCNDGISCTHDHCAAGLCHFPDNCTGGQVCDIVQDQCVAPPLLVAGDVILSAIQPTNTVGGTNSSEFILLFNTTDTTISLEQLEIIVRTDTDPGDGSLDIDWQLANASPDLTGAAIGAHRFFLVAESGVHALGGIHDLEVALDLATAEGGVSDLAIGIELIIDGVHMDHLLYGRASGSRTGASPPGDLPFDGTTYPRAEVIRNTTGSASFTEGLITRSSDASLYAGHDVDGYYIDEVSLGDGNPVGIWASPHSTAFSSYEVPNSRTAAVPRP
ncbi:MAG: EB domain-containing protein [Pseudomonadota bacterium]